jgi:hypothetical protein
MEQWKVRMKGHSKPLSDNIPYYAAILLPESIPANFRVLSHK